MELLVTILFIAGYSAIIFEHRTRVNKAAAAVLTGVLCWTAYILMSPVKDTVGESLAEHLAEISQILFFLLGAMTIVEMIDLHDGFEVITGKIRTTSKVKLMWIISLITFFLSAVLDNLTTSIVMVSMIRKLLSEKKDRMLMAGIIILAANSGGAWSPIGDVTTTMLWIGGQVTALNIILELFIPSLVSILVPLIFLSFTFKGHFKPLENKDLYKKHRTTVSERNLVFFLGTGVLILVPVFKTVTHLPPYMGILFGLGLLWIATELIHAGKNEEDKNSLSVVYALRKIDTPSILFFLGILLSVAALQSTGQLIKLSGFLESKIGNQNIIVMTIGLLSAVIDNVPLVAAAMGMYDLNIFPPDHAIWEFLAYCAGTGGSILIIGSAAGVTVMGMEKINFFWYLKRISLLALMGYFAGALVYLAELRLF